MANQQYPGGPPQQGYPGGPPQQGYPGGPQQQGYPGGPPQQGYPGGPPQQGYPGGPPQQGYPGAPQPGYGAPPNAGYAPPGGPAGGPAGPPPQMPAGATWTVPNDDPDDDESRQPSAPPPPDMSKLPTFQGFDVGAVGQTVMLPAPAMPPPSERPPAHAEFDKCAQLTEEECRDALLAYVSQFCCYGKGPAEKMEMTNFLASTALRYKLETFCEGRGTAYEFTPYTGQPVDGPQNGPPPSPWDIFVQPDHEFKSHVKKVEVPHTASVQGCHGCRGCGVNQCYRCYGRGRVRCSSCHGSGSRRTHRDGEWVSESCTWCHGSGRRRCHTCSGHGVVTCNTCQGARSVKWFVALTVTFANHEEDFIIENTDMPDHLVRDVQANVVFQETMFYCWPIQGYPVEQVARSSAEMIEKHKTAFSAEKRLNQRHTLLAIPVTEIHYSWKGNDLRYWVYGLDKKVHITDYPATCCCGCQIL